MLWHPKLCAACFFDLCALQALCTALGHACTRTSHVRQRNGPFQYDALPLSTGTQCGSKPHTHLACIHLDGTVNSASDTHMTSLTVASHLPTRLLLLPCCNRVSLSNCSWRGRLYALVTSSAEVPKCSAGSKCSTAVPSSQNTVCLAD